MKVGFLHSLIRKDEKLLLEAFAADLGALDQPIIVVLGANAVRDQLAERLESPKQVLTSVSGYSSVLSDRTAIDIIMMSYAGLRLRATLS